MIEADLGAMEEDLGGIEDNLGMVEDDLGAMEDNMGAICMGTEKCVQISKWAASGQSWPCLPPFY